MIRSDQNITPQVMFTITQSPHLPVYIIGAGIAGLSCAYHLQQHGLHSVILEARNRIGGRIHTLHSQHAYYDVHHGFMVSNTIQFGK